MVQIRVLVQLCLAASLAAGSPLVAQDLALSCPEGSRPLGRSLPGGKEQRCVLNTSGKSHGPFEVWYRNGNLRLKGSYRYGRPQGTWTYYYRNGQKRMEGNWRSSKPHGVWTYWYANGIRKSTGAFRSGKREGPWLYWDAHGNKRFEENWNDGVVDLAGTRASSSGTKER